MMLTKSHIIQQIRMISPPAKFLCISENLVACGAVDVDDESHPASIFLEAWIIQTLRLVKRLYRFRFLHLIMTTHLGQSPAGLVKGHYIM